VLTPGEAAGKAANENWAAREVYRQLVEREGQNPFKIIVTIVDADSVLSPAYLAHVEKSFWAQPDGRRMVYKGPLNVHRNFADGHLLVQCLELSRCHQDTFYNPMSVPYPYSNYSLTLGFAREIDFWTTDVMPEDIHTVNKAMVNSFGSRVTVTVPGIICNDMVPRIADRYVQAKRHQWGSVTEMAWTLSLFTDMRLTLPAWWSVFVSEALRPGSFVSTLFVPCSIIIELALGVLVFFHWDWLPDKIRYALRLLVAFFAWQTLCFWIVELTMWHTLLRRFPIRRPSGIRWLMLMILMPVAQVVNLVIFLVVPTLDAVHHATFRGDLAYVCASKSAI